MPPALQIVRYLSWPRRLEMLHDIAAGMVYLHNRHFVHGDLRSPNLFVSRDGKVCMPCDNLHCNMSAYVDDLRSNVLPKRAWCSQCKQS